MSQLIFRKQVAALMVAAWREIRWNPMEKSYGTRNFRP
jgi:hypothetical protein